MGAARAREVVGSFGPSTDFDLITGFGARLTVDQVNELTEDPSVLRVEPDREFTGSDAAGGPWLRGDPTREDLGLDGAGVGICVVDGGVLIGHEQFDGDLEAWADFAPFGPPDPGGSSDLDAGGHGTHVASIALGDGVGADPAKAADGGGVAPAADLYVARVLNQGAGTLSSVIAGIKWCVAGRRRRHQHVSQRRAERRARRRQPRGERRRRGWQGRGGLRGQRGDYPGSVASPGTAADVITVGAASDHSAVIPPLGGTSYDPSLFLGVFSGRGPTLSGLTKPDVVGPGSTVFAAVNTSPTTYGVKTGTSMATPYVAGAVALALQAVPGATPAQVKSALQTSAKDAGMPGKDNEWGAGLVDVRAFVDTLKGVVAPQRTPFPRHQFLRGVLTEAHPVATFELELGPADLNLAVNATGIASSGGVLTCPGNVCAFPVWAPRFEMRVYQGNVDGPTSIPPETCPSNPRYCESLRQSQLIFSVTDAGIYSVEVSLPPDYALLEEHLSLGRLLGRRVLRSGGRRTARTAGARADADARRVDPLRHERQRCATGRLGHGTGGVGRLTRRAVGGRHVIHGARRLLGRHWRVPAVLGPAHLRQAGVVPGLGPVHRERRVGHRSGDRGGGEQRARPGSPGRRRPSRRPSR